MFNLLRAFSPVFFSLIEREISVSKAASTVEHKNQTRVCKHNKCHSLWYYGFQGFHCQLEQFCLLRRFFLTFTRDKFCWWCVWRYVRFGQIRLKKWRETRSCFCLHFFRALAASFVLYNRKKAQSRLLYLLRLYKLILSNRQYLTL